MPIYGKLNSASWRVADGALAADEYVYVGELSDDMVWDASLQTMRTMTPVEVTRSRLQPITRAQAKAVLILNGLIGSVQPAIDGIADPMRRALAQNDWDERLMFERTNQTLTVMADTLGLTDGQLDVLFAQAATL